jgi:hypothetical protein
LLDESEKLRCRAGRAARAVRFFRGRKNSTAKSVFLFGTFSLTRQRKSTFNKKIIFKNRFFQQHLEKINKKNFKIELTNIP